MVYFCFPTSSDAHDELYMILGMNFRRTPAIYHEQVQVPHGACLALYTNPLGISKRGIRHHANNKSILVSRKTIELIHPRGSRPPCSWPSRSVTRVHGGGFFPWTSWPTCCEPPSPNNWKKTLDPSYNNGPLTSALATRLDYHVFLLQRSFVPKKVSLSKVF